METTSGIRGSGARNTPRFRTGHWFSLWLGFAAAACCSVGPVPAADAEQGSNAVMHASAAGGKADVASFLLKPEFTIEVVASEPMVTAPVAMAFDENGRLFVAEMPKATERDGSAPPLGRVRLLVGMDEDGSAKTSTTYADGLRWLSALACYGGGVFVATTPDVVFLKDTHGDSGADVRQVVLSDFGGTNKLAAEELLNNFNWGLDDRIHGATAGLGGAITASNWPGNSVSLAGGDFSFDPRTLQVFPEAGPSQSGLTFDSSGREFVSDFARPLRMALSERRYFLRNPFFPRAPELVNVLSPATPVFRFASGAAADAGAGRSNSPASGVKSNAFVPGWLTNARGVAVYRGNAFPSNYLGNVFIADPDGHAIHRVILRENGLGVQAERAADEQKSEFLMSRDPLFRPVQVVNGPDGALYIADMRDGRDQGRIYRVTAANFKRPPPPQLGLAKSYDLVAALASSNGWRRDTAARLLFERQDPAAAMLLSNMLSNSRLPVARLQALHALAGQGGLLEPHVLIALRDADAIVREHGVLLSEQVLTNGSASDALWQQLKPLAADPALRVRYQLAFTSGEVRRPDKVLVLAQILNHDLANPWVQSAVLSSLDDGAGDLFLLLAGTAGFRNNATGLAFLRQLATMIGAKGRQDEATQVLDFLARASLDPLQTHLLLNALGDGLERTRSSLALVDRRGVLKQFYIAAMNIAIDPTFVEPLRVEAIHLAGLSPYTFAEVGDWLLLLCNPPPVPAVQSAALAALGGFDDPGVFVGIVRVWPALTPALRTQALTALLSRGSRVGLVLDALQRGTIPLADASQTQLNFLRTHRNSAISEQAVKLFGPVAVRRPQVVEQFKPALRLTGAADRGRDIFIARCAACHRFGAGGQGLGPDLTGARTFGKEQILATLLEPNAHRKPQYAPVVVETKMGENLIGIESDENPTTLTLEQPGIGRMVWPRLNVASVQVQPWSFMPVGLEQGLSTQDIADLLAYLVTATP
ncbi:MAG TPA: PVC-type heme-binding CxxCH protein [Candidatus Acidoferrum sp.]|jgi:putative membrane-bound dehydrogenase-like protein|nr:PVC-type heme-binding CxxCH protein [Candidatus Acidoferrum sp.]